MDGSMLSAASIWIGMVVDVELGTLVTLMATQQMAIHFTKTAGGKDGLGVRFVLWINILSGIKIIHGMASLFVKSVLQGNSQWVKDRVSARIVQQEKKAWLGKLAKIVLQVRRLLA
jgi:hypothetical protein